MALLFLTLSLVLAWPTALAAASRVDLALVIAIDCSSSIDDGDFGLQMRGLAAALRHPDLAQAIASGPERAIALSVVQWSGQEHQLLVVPWQRLAAPHELDALARLVERLPRAVPRGSTGLSAAIDYSATLLFDGLHFTTNRRVIDISGDGENNDGGDPVHARNRAIARGVTINALPILSDGPRRLASYFQHFVIGGEDAFVIEAHGILDFRRAIQQKLVREIQRPFAQRMPSIRPVKSLRLARSLTGG